jgi:hypothetical protein
MSIKQPFFALLLAFSCLLITACGNDPATSDNGGEAAGQTEANSTGDGKNSPSGTDSDAKQEMTEGEAAGITPEAFNNSLKKLVAGKWKSDASPTQTIEFSESKYRRFNNNQLESEADFVIDSKCAASNCTIQGQKPFGWCFMVNEKGATNCYVVTTLNAVNLVIKLPANDGAAQSYTRVSAE